VADMIKGKTPEEIMDIMLKEVFKRLKKKEIEL
jgi:hypothetical protein